jgi:hypothetical protein
VPSDHRFKAESWPDTATPSDIAKSFTREATLELARLMLESTSDVVRNQAAQALLDRGWGKPQAEVQIKAPAGFVDVMQYRDAARELLKDPEARAAVRAAIRGEDA